MSEKALETLYRRKKITKKALKMAVSDGVITKEQYKTITGEKYA